MKIQRVTTLAFSISEKREKETEKKLKEKKKGKFLGFIGKGEKPEISHLYSPLGKFKATRLEKVIKGLLRDEEFETLECYFYIDLNNLELFYFNRDDEKPKIERFDVIKKIFNLDEGTIKTLGNLIRYGETKLEKLNPDAVRDLINLGLIKIFKPRLKELSALVIDELSPESPHKTIVKERVKITFHLPKFSNGGYNLTNFLKANDNWLESYHSQNIKYSIDKLYRVLGILFQAEISLIRSIIFIPFLESKYLKDEIEGKKIRILDRHFPVSLLNEAGPTKPGEKIVPLSLSTEIGTEEAIPIGHSTINFSDVVNLEEAKEEIRNEIIYPIIRPDLAKEFGRKAGGAILLYGPPGCGKTHLVKAAIGECFASFLNVNLADLVSKGVEIEPKILHDIFEEAVREAPSVIFIDEVDAIGGKKTVGGEHSARMLVNQLLMEMDGVESLKENVLFIAATNSPWSLEPALRRTERFTKQIFIPPPDLKTREQLFLLYTKGLPLAKDINFKELAKLTQGYACSDIKAICDSARETTWEEAMHGEKEREIKAKDFLKAISKQKSSLLAWFKVAREEIEKTGEVKLYDKFSEYILKYAGGVDTTEKPKLNFGDVGDLEKAKEKLRKKIIYPILNPQITKKFTAESGEAILLYGPPGCGKTYLAKATVGETNASFFNVRVSDIILKERGEPERKIQEIFDRAERNSPSIIFFDEIDALLGRRDLVRSEKRILAQFLVEMDGFEKRKGVFLIAATNIPWSIDPALRRAGRFTTQIYISPPQFNSRIEVFKIHLRGKKISPTIDFKKLASLTEGYSSADIKAICDSTTSVLWEEDIQDKKERKIETSDILTIIKTQKSSLPSWFKMAKKQLSESEEGDIYADVLRDILHFEKNNEGEKEIKKVLEEEKVKLSLNQRKKEKLEKLKNEQKKIEALIDTATRRYYTRKIDEESFRRIIKDYEKNIIELEMKIRKLTH